MLHWKETQVQGLLLQGNVGLERESLRIDKDGFFAETPDPFTGAEHIVRDFCENQLEINTSVWPSVAGALQELGELHKKICEKLLLLPKKEYLWLYSNPPYIWSEDDIPIAHYDGAQAQKQEYREYLANRYGRYKMTFSGIHFNYSFSEELLREDFKLSGNFDFTEYKNRLYLDLAEQAAAYGWLVTAVTAASPLMDISYVEKHRTGEDLFQGLASVRCSELGYWNYFIPTFDYSDVKCYTKGMYHYIEEGLLRYVSELYYPVRLKPVGENTLERLCENGIGHIELRMIDLNPLRPLGVEPKDLEFAKLLLIWLACTEHEKLDKKAQVQAVQNFKNAAHYDLKTVHIVFPNGRAVPVADAALEVISQMQEFYAGFTSEIQDILSFEKEKFLLPEKRYAWGIRQKYEGNYVSKLVLQFTEGNPYLQAE